MEQVALLIVGYDPYKDVWDDYFYLLNKYWKNRPATYLVCNELNPQYEGVKVINAGKDAEWSRKVQIALKTIKEKYIVLLLEDFFTTREVNSSKLNKLVRFLYHHNIDYCKLLSQSKIVGDSFKGKRFLHIIPKDSSYGISLQPSIWERNFLLELVGSENYNAWIFEFNQNKNKQHNINRINCLADDRNILEITHCVVQSHYLNTAIRVFKKQGFYINAKHIKPMRKSDEVKYYLKRVCAEWLKGRLRTPAKKIGRLLKIDFVSDRELNN